MIKRELGIHVTFAPNGEVGILDLDNRNNNAAAFLTSISAIDAQEPSIVERAVNAYCELNNTSPVQYSHTLRLETRNGVERKMIFSLRRGR